MKKQGKTERELKAAMLFRQILEVMQKTRRLMDAAAATQAWCLETRQKCQASARASRFTISLTREMRERRRASSQEPVPDYVTPLPPA